jgi:hypothetical protein
MEMSDQLRALTAPTAVLQIKSPCYPLDVRLGWRDSNPSHAAVTELIHETGTNSDEIAAACFNSITCIIYARQRPTSAGQELGKERSLLGNCSNHACRNGEWFFLQSMLRSSMQEDLLGRSLLCLLHRYREIRSGVCLLKKAVVVWELVENCHGSGLTLVHFYWAIQCHVPGHRTLLTQFNWTKYEIQSLLSSPIYYIHKNYNVHAVVGWGTIL